MGKGVRGKDVLKIEYIQLGQQDQPRAESWLTSLFSLPFYHALPFIPSSRPPSCAGFILLNICLLILL